MHCTGCTVGHNTVGPNTAGFSAAILTPTLACVKVYLASSNLPYCIRTLPNGTWLSTLRDQVVSFDFVFLVLGLTSIRVRVYIPHKMQDPVQSTPKSRLQASRVPLSVYFTHSFRLPLNVKVTQRPTLSVSALFLASRHAHMRCTHSIATVPRSTPHTHASSQRGGPSLATLCYLYAPRPRQPLCLPAWASSTSA